VRGALICAVLLAGCAAPVDRHRDCDAWPWPAAVQDDGRRAGDCARDDRPATRQQVADREPDQPGQPGQPDTIDHDDPGHSPDHDTQEERDRHHPGEDGHETEQEDNGHAQE